MSLEEYRKVLDRKGSQIFKLRDEMQEILLGEPGAYLTKGLLMALLAGGHILIESVPGMAKTLAIKTLSNLVDADQERIQFRSDLLPTDIIGLRIYREGKEEFEVEKGPIFSNFVLADEINRSPPNTQSALLEPMAEQKVTIGDEDYLLPSGVSKEELGEKAIREERKKTFLVMATQNPIEEEGVHPLPETAIDRFQINLIIHYPNKESEAVIAVEDQEDASERLGPIMKLREIEEIREAVQNGVYLDDDLLVKNYILNMVHATRSPEDYDLDNFNLNVSPIELGGSPRASENIVKVSKASAFLNGRVYVAPPDVQYAARNVLRHRIIMKRAAIVSDFDSENIIDDIFDKVFIP